MSPIFDGLKEFLNLSPKEALVSHPAYAACRRLDEKTRDTDNPPYRNAVVKAHKACCAFLEVEPLNMTPKGKFLSPLEPLELEPDEWPIFYLFLLESFIKKDERLTPEEWTPIIKNLLEPTKDEFLSVSSLPKENYIEWCNTARQAANLIVITQQRKDVDLITTTVNLAKTYKPKFQELRQSSSAPPS